MPRFLMILPTIFFLVGLLAPSAGSASPGDATACGLFRQLSEEYKLNTAGAALIRDGRVPWTCFAGEEAPGVQASARTRFNVASITKVIVTEAILMEVDAGRLDLNESMAPWWIDPDLVNDPRHERLTPRMVLTHQTGLPNWRYFAADRRLNFEHDPGTAYGYSGEGFHYLAAYAARKLAVPFSDIVESNVFEPLGMRSAAMIAHSEDTRHFARSLDENGVFPGFWCRPGGWCQPEGFASAAGGLRVTVGDLATFLIEAADGLGYGPELLAQRSTVHTPLKGEDADMPCSGDNVTDLPSQGYGLGWRVLSCEDKPLLFHGGSDWAELAIAAISPLSRNGFLVLLNEPNIHGARAMPELLRIIAPDSPLVAHYEQRRDRAEAGS